MRLLGVLCSIVSVFNVVCCFGFVVCLVHVDMCEWGIRERVCEREMALCLSVVD